FLALAGEKFAGRFDLLDVLLARDIADARRGAVFQIRVEAMLIILLGWSEWAATAQIELAPHQCERAAQRAGADERPKINRAIVLLDARQREAGNWIAKVHLQHQESFIVTKADIVTRVKFLDQLAFQQQGLRFVAHEMNIEVMDCVDQRGDFQVPGRAARRLEISRHALALVARLADIDDRAESIL